MAAPSHQIASLEENASGSSARQAVQKLSATESCRDPIIGPNLDSLGRRIKLALMSCKKLSDFLSLCLIKDIAK